MTAKSLSAVRMRSGRQRRSSMTAKQTGNRNIRFKAAISKLRAVPQENSLVD